ncbi:unnamed protein product [Sphagnum jensenii]|uniref:Uncharacterized protein n=1 Tax=Sphagnum jensenii TaxID=128206 RepID=A0ABP0XK51_9BRYO
MVGSKDSCNGTKQCGIQHVFSLVFVAAFPSLPCLSSTPLFFPRCYCPYVPPCLYVRWPPTLAPATPCPPSFFVLLACICYANLSLADIHFDYGRVQCAHVTAGYC